MTTTAQAVAGTPGSPPVAAASARRGPAGQTVLLAVAGFIVVLSVIAAITGADELTSSGTVGAALALAVPIGMAGLGGLWSERAGVVNIGLEGMMILGTWGAGWAGYQWGPWVGVLVGVLMGAAGGLLHAIATVTFGVDHIVSGVAINILGLGVTQFLSVIAFEGTPGGGESQSPPIGDISEVSIPGIGDPLDELQDKGWFLVSDLAGIVRGLTVGISLLTLVAILLVVGTYYVLWRTAFGLRLRSCGESPVAAESLGVNVYLMKYAAVLVSGGLRRHGRRLPRTRARQRLPRGPDRRPRLHRPGGHDLRQLAARRPGGRRRPVRLHRRAAAAQRRGGPRAAAPRRCPARRCQHLAGGHGAARSVRALTVVRRRGRSCSGTRSPTPCPSRSPT